MEKGVRGEGAYMVGLWAEVDTGRNRNVFVQYDIQKIIFNSSK